jgi:ABC-type multidrug transport system fused ATPase/permease subunit
MMKGIIAPFSRLYSVLPKHAKRRLPIVVLISLLTALFETASVASILPFMMVVMDPGVISTYPWLKQTLTTFGILSQQAEIITAGVLTVVVLVLGNSVSAFNLWVQTKFTAAARRELASDLFNGYMKLPYGFHIQRDAASLLRVVDGDVQSALSGFLASLLIVVSKVFTGLILTALIVVVDPYVALGAIVVLGGGYFAVYKLIRVRQTQLGEKMVNSGLALGRASIEGLAGIKELRVLGRESTSAQMYKDALSVATSTTASNTLATALPRYVIEVFAYAGIVAITLILVMKGEATAAMPSLALYALAGNRLAPTFQQLFSAAVTIKYHTRAVESLEADLAVVRGQPQLVESELDMPMAFTKEIRLTDLSFTYPSANRPALNNISLSIAQNQSIGLVGRTGSGKTTLADILLGLYPPSSGEIEVDGTPMTLQNERSWRKRVGYVPQHVFLTNASVAQNIALGVPEDQIDHVAVARAAEMAQAEEFIVQLPEQYDTVVGERGVKLSGGQRQRLGIARALYHNPDVLVFDEATSALDGMTEDAVMQAVQRLSSDRTMILIAHRLRTVQACDRIVMLDAGCVVADGPYDTLMSDSEPFKKLAGQINYKDVNAVS